jgi:hypothetical protein
MTDTAETLSLLLSSESSAQFSDGRRHDNIDARVDVSRQETTTPDRTPVQTCEEKLYSIISENNGKLIFSDLLTILGGPHNKKLLYNVLSKLARQGKVTRIRGIGKQRIEFYYYDTRKIKKLPKSAAQEFIPHLA